MNTKNSWTRNQSTGAGLSIGVRGGMSTGSTPYISNIPLWAVFVRELEKIVMHNYAALIRKHLSNI